MANQREFQLIQDSIAKISRQTGDLGLSKRPPLVVPDGPSYLAADGSRGLRITAARSQQADKDRLLLEPVGSGQHLKLLLLSPGERRVRVNGRLAPRLCLLGEQDQFQVDQRHVLHVAIYNRSEPGPAGDDRVGTECPICRTKFTADAIVYTCPHCATPMHLQGEETPLDARLECALAVSECPLCRNKTQMTEGYTWTPELYCA
jgi:hypothetical protein